MRSSCTNQLGRFEPAAHVAPRKQLVDAAAAEHEQGWFPGMSARGHRAVMARARNVTKVDGMP
jgi:hypothetical protein